MGATATNITFKRPGAVHYAGWMAKATYSLKIFLFRNKFYLTKSEIAGLKELSLFTIIFYLKAWYTAPCTITAPNNDLNLIKELISYKIFNNTISRTCSGKSADQLWYLNNELSVSFLFDETVSVETKKNT